MRDELRKSLAFLPGGTEPWIWIFKPSESRIKKFVCGGSLPTAPLSVKGPTKNELRRTIILSGDPAEPMVDQRGLADTGPGNNCHDIYLLICPGVVQESDVLLSPKNIASSNGQPSDGNLLRCRSRWRLASSDA